MVEGEFGLPRDYSPLDLSGDHLLCPGNHAYPIIDGVPVMLLNDVEPTPFSILASLERAVASRELKRTAEQSIGRDVESRDIHPHVQKSIVDSCGNLYIPLINKLSRYPVWSSEVLRWMSEKAQWMGFFADSVYVKARRITARLSERLC